MSLLGSLEDLGLGDILEIIHLSQKSGVLSIRGEAGEGRLVFQAGLVRLASLKGDPENVLELVVDRGFLTTDQCGEVFAAAGESGCALSVAVANLTAVSLEQIESLRRECIERAVGTMFTWSTGDFIFDVGAEDEYIESDMALSVGVSAQYLAMESLRVWDEGGHGQAGVDAESEGVADAFEQDFALAMSAEEMFGVAASGPKPAAAAFERMAKPSPTAASQAIPATVEQVESPFDVEVPTMSSQPVVVIAPELSVLEWVRSSLSENFASVHIFQRSQEGLGRIRQYLARAQTPILLVSPHIEGNPLSGIVDAADFVVRLQGQAPRMPILWLVAQVEAEESLPSLGLPSVIHPQFDLLARSGGATGAEDLSRQVARMLINATAAHRATRRIAHPS
jgi:hypothetical protein